jgi:hypothetical protein
MHILQAKNHKGKVNSNICGCVFLNVDFNSINKITWKAHKGPYPLVFFQLEPG